MKKVSGNLLSRCLATPTGRGGDSCKAKSPVDRRSSACHRPRHPSARRGAGADTPGWVADGLRIPAPPPAPFPAPPRAVTSSSPPAYAPAYARLSWAWEPPAPAPPSTSFCGCCWRGGSRFLRQTCCCCAGGASPPPPFPSGSEGLVGGSPARHGPWPPPSQPVHTWEQGEGGHPFR